MVIQEGALPDPDLPDCVTYWLYALPMTDAPPKGWDCDGGANPAAGRYQLVFVAQVEFAAVPTLDQITVPSDVCAP